MSGSLETWDRTLARVPRLLRERRLEEAEALLEGWIVAEPEIAARELLLARLVALQPERWDQVLATALRAFGFAPLAAYQRTTGVLDGIRAERLARLSPPVSEPEAPASEPEPVSVPVEAEAPASEPKPVAVPVEAEAPAHLPDDRSKPMRAALRLEGWLEKVRGGCATGRSDAPEGEGLDRGSPDVGADVAEMRDPRVERIASSLEAWVERLAA
ncbi:MAG: hypothetical protein HQM01_01270 [Magnetococcales bacterium]|nr:hypothetical protein [Magnetococcales bacterium]